ALGGGIDAIRRLDAANGRFHGILVVAARHDRLARILERTVDSPLVFQALRQFQAAELERSALFHGLIRDAVAEGDGASAGRLMTEQVLHARDVLQIGLAAEVRIEELKETARPPAKGAAKRPAKKRA